MAWTIEYSETALKQLRKLDRSISHKIVDYLANRIALLEDPRSEGHALTGGLKGHWRYRVGDYRIVCEVKDQVLLVFVLKIGHRREVYR